MNKSQHTSITNGIGGHVPKRAMESLAVVCLRMDVIMQSNYLSLSLSYRSSILLTLHCFASELLLAITVTNAIPLNRFEFHSSTEVRRHFHLPTTLHPNEWNAIILFSVDSFSFFSVRFMPLCAIREKFSRLCAAPTRLYWSFPNGKLSLSLSYLSNDDWFKMTHNTLLTISSLSVWFFYPRQLTMFSYGLYRFLSIIQRNAQIDSFFPVEATYVYTFQKSCAKFLYSSILIHLFSQFFFLSFCFCSTYNFLLLSSKCFLHV